MVESIKQSWHLVEEKGRGRHRIDDSPMEEKRTGIKKPFKDWNGRETGDKRKSAQEAWGGFGRAL